MSEFDIIGRNYSNANLMVFNSLHVELCFASSSVHNLWAVCVLLHTIAPDPEALASQHMMLNLKVEKR